MSGVANLVLTTALCPDPDTTFMRAGDPGSVPESAQAPTAMTSVMMLAISKR